MSLNQVEKMIEDAQSNKELYTKLVSISEPKEADEKEVYFENLVSVGKAFDYNFTKEDCKKMWDAKESVYQADRNEEDKAVLCGISQDECMLISQYL